jgi:transposase InsO family protein
MSRQNYYATRRRRQRQWVDGGVIVNLVRRERQQQPRLGGRKLLHMLGAELAENDVRVGRDRFFDVLRESGLLVERKRCQAKTTNSRHSLPVFRNLVTGREVTAPNEVWVSDLTYIRTEEGFLFSALITDKFSRKIVGAHIGDSLEAEGCLQALDEALAGLPGNCFPIHHSDRGCQYCCHAYVDRLRDRGLTVSMTETLHCYENALAERVNGILKQEYELDRTFRRKAQAIAAFWQAVWLYNTRRPHLALDYRTPAKVHEAPHELREVELVPASLRSALGPPGRPPAAGRASLRDAGRPGRAQRCPGYVKSVLGTVRGIDRHGRHRESEKRCQTETRT